MYFLTYGEDKGDGEWAIDVDTVTQRVDVGFDTSDSREAVNLSFDANTLDLLIEALTCAREELD